MKTSKLKSVIYTFTNWNPKGRDKLFILLPLMIIVSILLGWSSRDIYNDFTKQKALEEGIGEYLEENESQKIIVQKELENQEESPDGKNIIIKYDLKPLSSSDYYDDYFDNKSTISIKDLGIDKEYSLYTGDDRIGSPHWLGNDHIFFTGYCGTSCQGLYLIAIRNREVAQAVLTYLVPARDDIWTTHFRDWFDQEFFLEGFVEDIKGKVDGNKTYLVFKMIDINRRPLGEKHFLFTINKLIQIK